MNTWLKYLAFILIILASVGTVGCGTVKSENAYDAIISVLSEEQSYAFVDNHANLPILLITDKIYDYDGTDASTSCDVYYTWNGEIQNLGQLSSNGTAYPIRYDEKGIYTAGNHFVARYVVDEKDQRLALAEYANETFDGSGDVTYLVFHAENGEQKVKNGSYLETMFEKWEKANIVNFEKQK